MGIADPTESYQFNPEDEDRFGALVDVLEERMRAVGVVLARVPKDAPASQHEGAREEARRMAIAAFAVHELSVHEAGLEAYRQWCSTHEHVILRYLAERHNTSVPSNDGNQPD